MEVQAQREVLLEALRLVLDHLPVAQLELMEVLDQAEPLMGNKYLLKARKLSHLKILLVEPMEATVTLLTMLHPVDQLDQEDTNNNMPVSTLPTL